MKNLFYFLAIALMAMACGKKMTCPPFAEQNIALLIYKANDTIKFANNTDTLLLITQNITKSEEYSLKCRDLYGICNCESSANISASTSVYPNTFTLVKLTKYDNSEAEIYKFRFWDFELEIDFVDFEKNINYIDNVTLFDTLSINNQMFNKVFCFTNPNANSSKVRKIYINRQFGILKIEEQQNSKVWRIVLQ